MLRTPISPHSGRDCVKSLRSSYTGLYPQTPFVRRRVSITRPSTERFVAVQTSPVDVYICREIARSRMQTLVTFNLGYYQERWFCIVSFLELSYTLQVFRYEIRGALSLERRMLSRLSCPRKRQILKPRSALALKRREVPEEAEKNGTASVSSVSYVVKHGRAPGDSSVCGSVMISEGCRD